MMYFYIIKQYLMETLQFYSLKSNTMKEFQIYLMLRGLGFIV